MVNLLNKFIPGSRLIDGTDLNNLVSSINGLFGGTSQQSGVARVSTQAGITAHAGGGRASAVPLTAAISEISVVATIADSVVLPVALAGAQMTVLNEGAAAAQVFANGTDTINGTAGATGISLAAAAKAIFVCYQTGKWIELLSA